MDINNGIIINDIKHERKTLLANDSKKKFQKWVYPLIIVFSICVAVITIVVAIIFWSPGSQPVVPSFINWSQKGMTFTNGKYCPWVRFGTDKSSLSLTNLASTGANFVSIIVTQFQDNINTTNIYNTSFTATDTELGLMIQLAHNLGMKVMIKPQLDLYMDPDHWRGEIGMFFNSSKEWDEWFNSYSIFIVHYAALSQDYGVEQFSLGCELISTSPNERNWREIASQVRQVYSGTITYAANWGGEETNKTWWDAVDLIGVDAYYPLCPDLINATVIDLVNCWQEIIEVGDNNGVDGGYMSTSLRNLSLYWNKSMIFTEIGYCSGGCIYGPNVDLDYQLIHYEADIELISKLVFHVFANISWFEGVFWWNWVSDPAFGGEYNYCCTPQFKPTENLMRLKYGGSKQSQVPSYPAECPCIL